MIDPEGSNCPIDDEGEAPCEEVQPCIDSEYGCCRDGTTVRADHDGTNCPDYEPPTGC